ncbi:hypothetical protein [Burkholderia gladioli]|uniref:hypothetical protein n=1 Tax=Burkholderia gladioli TaxID=28095 RepID=UPI00163FBADD|nr:hypothetical protein [Burkholderia gladioli]
MSDKLSDEQIRELADDTDSGRTTSGKRLFSDRNLLAFARALLAASPAPAIPAYPAKHISLKMRRDRKIVLTLELDAVEGAPAYLLTPVNPCVVRAVPAISESEDALLTAARRAIPALAHAAERNPVYQRDYEELSRAIDDAARKGEKS